MRVVLNYSLLCYEYRPNKSVDNGGGGGGGEAGSKVPDTWFIFSLPAFWKILSWVPDMERERERDRQTLNAVHQIDGNDGAEMLDLPKKKMLSGLYKYNATERGITHEWNGWNLENINGILNITIFSEILKNCRQISIETLRPKPFFVKNYI